MKKLHVAMYSALLMLLCSAFSQAQTPTQTASALPRLVRFSGTAKDLNGNPLTGVVGITFALYSEQTGGAALWLETQNVTADSNGHYTALLGSTKPDGLPAELFTSEQAHWVGVQVSGQAEQPRVLLVSAPYALKAGDAETLGGKPASAFVTVGSQPPQPSASPAIAVAAVPAITPATTPSGSGTTDYIPLWTSSTALGDSILFQSSGAMEVMGTLELPALDTATSSTGYDSQPLDLFASAYNSSSKAAVEQHFRWKAEPVSNDTSAASGKVDLLYASGTSTPAETGLSISSKGTITFASGQTLPAVTGNETVSGNVSASQLISTVATGTAPLKVTSTTEVANLNASLLDGLASRAFAQLAANNTFSGTQTINNTTAISGTNSSGVLQVTNTTTSGGAPAIVGTTNSTGASGIKGLAPATSGIVNGVFGDTSSSSGYGVQGQSPNTGVYGQASGASKEGLDLGFNTGVWGDTGGAEGEYVAIEATADENSAGAFYNNSSEYDTLYAENDAESSGSAVVFETNGSYFDGHCTIDASGDLACNGSKSAVVPVDGGSRNVALYAIEGPENWFEDAGSAQLSNGAWR
jgi:hypothetical protein